MESETGRNAGRKEEQDMEYRIVEKNGKQREDQWYLAAITEDADRVDMTSFWMQMKRDCPWLVPMRYVSYEGRNAFYYDMEGQVKVDIQEICRTREGILNTLIGICDAVMETERHMISPNQLVWDWNYIFRGRNGLSFIAVPICVGNDADAQIGNVFFGILGTVQETMKEQEWYRSLIEYITKTGYIDCRTLKPFLYRLSMERKVESAHTGQTTLLTAALDPSNRAMTPAGQDAGWRTVSGTAANGREMRRTSGRFFGRKTEKPPVYDERIAGSRPESQGFGETIIVRAM